MLSANKKFSGYASKFLQKLFNSLDIYINGDMNESKTSICFYGGVHSCGFPIQH
jgi:hypothetical protein